MAALTTCCSAQEGPATSCRHCCSAGFAQKPTAMISRPSSSLASLFLSSRRPSFSGVFLVAVGVQFHTTQADEDDDDDVVVVADDDDDDDDNKTLLSAASHSAPAQVTV